ncbi:hypothetical protein CNMCM5793_005045 [Aspergillus hiratsukae]|uniref:Ubiquitin-protein ligase E3A N-terminal zinc-binding domain-containing protein n=1 Tax=Aspergillus hiratsukae TaxID=1194566 RepID=A0A8H6P4M9_9EURO|nr:hypothetical protein CNMCM5793_005045 [Aspergillus hiratsukae]KAF7156752.1 hypothetical protein CNMCM6106_001194 [Aspergillus hiratsukae]
MAGEQDSLQWSSQFFVAPPQRTPKLPGDKITLPQSALEQLLAAAPLSEVSPQGSSRQYTSTFDPFNPHTFAAESRARAQDLDRQKQLPHPLTFRLVNPKNDRAIYAGIREFSAEEQEVGLSAFLRRALDIGDELFQLQTGEHVTETAQSTDLSNGGESESHSAPTVTVHAKQLPKGTYVRLRPLEAGYDPEDWKALLERHLRDNFTTLTTGELLSVSGNRNELFRFLVDRVEPEGDGICVVDTDLEVDIVPLTEDQARETLQRRLEKASRAPGTKGGSSIGGVLAVGETVTGQVIPGEYVDYELGKWDREEMIEVELEGIDDAVVYLFASPFSARQRNRPRLDEHVFADFSSQTSKKLRIRPTNVELDGAEALYLSVHAYAQSEAGDGMGSSQTLPLRYSIRVVQSSSAVQEVEQTGDQSDTHEPGDVQCKNCHQWVPQRTLVLHENFCLRNNVLCPQCGNVFQKRSPEWENHWHCPHDSFHGNDVSSKHRHDSIFHTRRSCPGCGFEADSLPSLAQHRTTVCPEKPILCQFCHLVVPQRGETDPDMLDPEVLLSGLTPHELVDGGRTTECHLCNKIIRLRDMKTHLRHHDLERLSRPAPRICLNQNCGRTLDARVVQSTITPGTDTLGLCSICFGPLYVDTYDPEGKALRRRIERRYLSQLMTGCGKPWCQNEYCKTGKQHRLSSTTGDGGSTSMSAAQILALVRPLIDAVNLRRDAPNTAPFYFCTDQVGQQRRILAEMLAAEGTMSGGKTYDLPWCVAAVEATAGNLDKAREWLTNWAPAKDEDKRSIR